jgi:hypothetical protein
MSLNNGPIWRRRVVPISPAKIISDILRKLEEDIICDDTDFNPVHILARYADHPSDLKVNEYIGFNMAELIRRIRCLMYMLKKIDTIDHGQYIWEDTIKIIYPHWQTILLCGKSKTYTYTIMDTLYNLYTRLMKMFNNLNGCIV